MNRSFVFFALACFSSLYSCSDQTPTAAPAVSATQQCIDRGIEYYKEIGSYPTLSSAPNAGRSAESVVSERCARSVTAF